MSGATVTELFARLGLEVDEGAFNVAQNAIGGLRRGLTTMAAAAAGFGAAIAGALKTTADRADMIDEVAQRTGVATGFLQEMGYAASFAGVGMEEMARAMNHLARKGSKDVQKDIGLIADQIKALTEQGRGPEAAALAMQKFGRSGARLVPVLAKGSEELKRLGLEAHAFGQVMDESTLQAGAAFNDSLDRLNFALKGIVYTLAGPLLEPVREVIQAFAEWVATNRELIASRLTTFVRALGIGLKIVWAVLKPFRAVLGWIVETSARWKTTLAILSGILIYKLAAGLLLNSGLMTTLTALTTAWGQASLLAGARAALAPVLAAAPWVALIALVVLLIEDIYVALKGGKSALMDWGKEINAWLDSLEAKISGWVERIVDKLGIKMPDRLKKLFANNMGEMFSKGPLLWLLNSNKDGSLLGPGGFIREGWDHIFGGGSSPQAASQNAPRGGSPYVLSPKFSAQFTIQQQPGQNEQDVGSEVERRLERFWETKMGEADAAVAGTAVR